MWLSVFFALDVAFAWGMSRADVVIDVRARTFEQLAVKKTSYSTQENHDWNHENQVPQLGIANEVLEVGQD